MTTSKHNIDYNNKNHNNNIEDNNNDKKINKHKTTLKLLGCDLVVISLVLEI